MRRLPLPPRLVTFARYSRALAPLTARLQRRDDFAWSTYTGDSYRTRLEHASTTETRQLARASWHLDGDRIVLDSGNPLHPAHRLLYETVLSLHPRSVCEFGFGGGDHLANLSLLLPKASLLGFEVSEDQLAFARERNGLDGIALHVCDMTALDAAAGFENAADVVFCNAVLMHIHGRARHSTFLRSMLAVSSRYVLFAENWLRHDYVRDVRELGLSPYLVSAEQDCALLLDKRGEVDLPVARSDRELRRLCRS
jgi:methyltransferase family protein